MITRHNGNFGISLFRWGRIHIELWLCRKGSIPSHRHNQMDSKLIFLWGNILGTIGERTKRITGKDAFRVFDIPHGITHGAIVNSRFCAFLNIERWIGSPRSAALDFEA